MMFKHERWKQDCYIEAEEAVVYYVSTTKEWIMGHINPFDSAIDAFKFLPIFLILAYAAFLLVDRWRTFMVLCHTIQGMKSAFSLVIIFISFNLYNHGFNSPTNPSCFIF